jgi:small conductance mechanosensitive channel
VFATRLIGNRARASWFGFPAPDYNDLAMTLLNINKLLPELRIAGERIITGILILLAFWFAARIAEVVIRRAGHKMPHNAGLLAMLGRIAKITIVMFGAATALGTMGVNVSALVAGLGLTGFALGFAFHDVLSNLLAGILLLFFHPFETNDQISVTGLDGKVINIDLRYTVLQQSDKIVLIPNSTLFTNPILVMGKGPKA